MLGGCCIQHIIDGIEGMLKYHGGIFSLQDPSIMTLGLNVSVWIIDDPIDVSWITHNIRTKCGR